MTVAIASGGLILLLASATLILALNLCMGKRQLRSPLARLYSTGDPQFLQAMSAAMGPALVPGNQVKELLNGDEIFAAMLGSLRGARVSITLETYIYWSGTIGDEFARELAHAARRGVQVKVLLDWIGGHLDDRHLKTMTSAGVDIRRYNPPRWFNLHRMNNRTHRKLMVVDGSVGFIGGVGIGDEWRGCAQDRHHWRDTHFQVDGPVVTQLQSAFIDNWLQSAGEVLHGVTYLPVIASQGECRAQVFRSSPAGGAHSMELLYLMAITAAERSIELSASYFLPRRMARQALIDAAQRGVRVRILLPGPQIDKALVRRASRALWGDMLKAGVEIFEYQPTMFHCKVIVVDGVWVSVGSTNIDSRSFTINDEANMNVFDERFAARQTDVFERDLRCSDRVSREAWADRGTVTKLIDGAAGLLRSQL